MEDPSIGIEEAVGDGLDNLEVPPETLQHQSVDHLRNQYVPAYTFTQFAKLAMELRLRIWSFAARFEEPKTHEFVCGDDKYKGCSRICQEAQHDGRKHGQAILQVCRESRLAALKVFTALSYHGRDPENTAYFNTLYDSFYLGVFVWKEFKLLVDIIISQSTTCTLHEPVVRDLTRLQSIRSLIVDLNIFAAVPARVWTEFPYLERLTIAFYPFEDIQIVEHDRAYDEGLGEPWDDPAAEFLVPDPRNRFGYRAKRIVEHALNAFEAIHDEAPTWFVPEITAVVRKTGAVQDDWIEVYDSEDEWNENLAEVEEYEEGGDRVYYENLRDIMVHKIPLEDIGDLKRQYLEDADI